MNRNDRRVSIAALAVLLLTALTLVLTGRYDTSSDALPADSLSHDRCTAGGHPQAYGTHGSYQPAPRHAQPYAAEPAYRPETFPFDPNTADSTQLLRLGLQPWQVRNIYRYRSRGGVYRRKEDFARLYGLTVKDYRRLEPYIRISTDYLPASTLFAKSDSMRRVLHQQERDSMRRDTVQRPAKLREGETIDLNTADTLLLRRVPGIGAYYAREIVYYRQRLGGYASTAQLDEIPDFPTTAKAYFTVSTSAVRRININKLSLQQLRRHPYINFYQAKAIIDYRRLRGPLKSLQDLRLSKDFPPEAIERLLPYIDY